MTRNEINAIKKYVAAFANDSLLGTKMRRDAEKELDALAEDEKWNPEPLSDR